MKVFNNVGLSMLYFDITPLKELISYEQCEIVMELFSLVKTNGEVITPAGFVSRKTEEYWNSTSAIAISMNIVFYSRVNDIPGNYTIKEILESIIYNGASLYDYIINLPRLTKEEFYGE